MVAHIYIGVAMLSTCLALSLLWIGAWSFHKNEKFRGRLQNYVSPVMIKVIFLLNAAALYFSDDWVGRSIAIGCFSVVVVDSFLGLALWALERSKKIEQGGPSEI